MINFLQHEHITTQNLDKEIILITLTRPLKKNALTLQIMQTLEHNINLINKSNSIKVLIVTGEENFSAGLDLNTFTKENIDSNFLQSNTWLTLSTCNKIVIAAVEGYCLGGGFELVQMCDLVIASHTSIFGQVEINHGLIPGLGGTQRLITHIGINKTKELVLLGKKVGPDFIQNMLYKIVDPLTTLDQAKSLAQNIVKNPNNCLQSIKMLTNSVFNNNFNLKLEAEAFYNLFYKNKN